MNKKNLLIIFLFFLRLQSFGQDFQWVKQFEGSYFSGDNSSMIEVDSNENSYTFGMIYDELFDIDPTAGVTQIIDNTPQSTAPCSLFLTKLNSNGDFVWGKTFGTFFGTADRVIDMEIGIDGNIYLLADIYEQRINFRQKYITIFKLDPQGNILLTKKITNVDNPSPYDVYYSSSLALDNQNNIYISGSYKHRINFDLSNPQLNFNVGGDSFILKINNVGNIVFGRRFNVLFTNTHYERVKIDNTQNPIVVVSNGDNQSYTSYGYNIFKINSTDGSTVWQKFLENQNPQTFNIDLNGNIVIAGSGKNGNGPDIDVDPGPSVLNINPKPYVLWLTGNGDFLDVKKFPPVSAYPYFLFSSIEFDTSNNSYIVGEFIHIFDADPSSNTFLLSYICGAQARDAFYIKLDSNRNFDNAFKLGDYNNNCVNFYFTDFKIRNDNQYYVGNFGYVVDFDPTTGIYLANSSSNPFGARFTLKLGPCDTTRPQGNNTQLFCSSQNPTIGNLLPNSTSIKWYPSATATTPLNVMTALVSGQTYYASRQNGNCPESTQRLDVTVTINPAPSMPVSINQTFCASDNATISSLLAIGQNIKWYSSSTEVNSLPPTTTLQNNTTYYLTQTANGCESNRASINVTLNTVTMPTLVSPQTFCVQQNATLSSIAVNGQNIKWYNSTIGGNLLPDMTILVNGTTYYASQSINNCESLRIPVLIIIENTSTPTGAITQTFCAIQSPTLNDIAVDGTNLIWYIASSGLNTIPVTTPLVDGVTYYASQTINNCESVNRLAVTATIINTLNANDYSQTICDDLNDGSEIISLPNFNISLLPNGNNFRFEYYTTASGANNQLNTELVSNATAYDLTTGLHTVYVRITSVEGCHQIVKLNLTLVKSPIINIPETLTLCEKSNVTIDAGSGFDSYAWSTTSIAQTITVSQAGNYSVTVTTNYGSVSCSTTKNFNVVLSNAAMITSIEIQDWNDNNNIIIVNTLGYGDYEFSIDGINYQSNNIFNGLSSGIYTVSIRDKNGCGISTEDVYLLSHPKYFTPNNDGYNDTWAIKFSYFEKGLKVLIFDRYGKLLKTLNNTSAWDGKFNDAELPSSDYWFVVIRENGKEYRGHFALIR
ncbi:Ig-like domain-containing protein [Flavobacterium sp. 25HG05S-40]|uniref:Ig-like domain-containing protein n=1 Tax=Flavobacterium sp. 25HG05S-40 TaxID=3458682 RepID=UPI004044BDBE